MSAAPGPDLARIAKALQRLDRRRHVAPARLELSDTSNPQQGWVTQIMADPLTRPVVGFGPTPDAALAALAQRVDALDWRRVKR